MAYHQVCDRGEEGSVRGDANRLREISLLSVPACLRGTTLYQQETRVWKQEKNRQLRFFFSSEKIYCMFPPCCAKKFLMYFILLSLKVLIEKRKRSEVSKRKNYSFLGTFFIFDWGEILKSNISGNYFIKYFIYWLICLGQGVPGDLPPDLPDGGPGAGSQVCWDICRVSWICSS